MKATRGIPPKQPWRLATIACKLAEGRISYTQAREHEMARKAKTTKH